MTQIQPSFFQSFNKLCRQFLLGTVELFYPPFCLGCEQLITEQNPLKLVCRNCFATLATFPEEMARLRILARLRPNHLDNLHIAYCYNPVLRKLIHGLKYRKMPDTGLQLAKTAAAQFPELAITASNTLIIPVPLHLRRQKERGYNQAEIMATGFFTEAAANIQTGILVRDQQTTTQTRFGRALRSRNIKSAFRVLDPARVAGQQIMVVDDVVTTGATLNECARRLKYAGATSVIAVALASPLEKEEV